MKHSIHKYTQEMRHSLFTLPLFRSLAICSWCVAFAYIAGITLYNIGESSLWPASDEMIHTRVTQEMFHNNTWLPSLDNKPYFNKPPLKMWLTHIPLHVMGESTLSYRLTDGCAGFLTCLLSAIGIFFLSRSHSAALLTALILASSPTYILGRHGVRVATQDAFLVFLTTRSALILWLLRSKVKNHGKLHLAALVALGTVIGCAILTKSAAGLLPLLIITFLVIVDPQLRNRLLNTTAIFLLVGIPLFFSLLYYLPLAASYDSALSQAFGREVVQRAVGGFHNQSSPLFYVLTLFDVKKGIWTFTPPLLVGFGLVSGIFLLRNRIPQGSTLFLYSHALVPIVLYSCAQSRLPWYVMPSLPFLSGICALSFVAATELVVRSCSAYAGRFSRIVGVISLVALITVGFSPILKNSTWVAHRIVHPIRIPYTVDTLVQEIFSQERTDSTLPPFKVLLYIQEYSLRGEHRRKFNGEALYLRMLRKRLEVIKSSKQITSNQLTGFDLAIIEEPLFVDLTQCTNRSKIPPFHFRKRALILCGVSTRGGTLMKALIK